MVLGPDLALTMICEASPIPSWTVENPLLLVVGKFLLGGRAVLERPRVPSLNGLPHPSLGAPCAHPATSLPCQLGQGRPSLAGKGRT